MTHPTNNTSRSKSQVRIAVQVLNGATGEVRELVAHVTAANEREAVNMLFNRARKDDHYYRFLGWRGVVSPIHPARKSVQYQGQEYWALESN